MKDARVNVTMPEDFKRVVERKAKEQDRSVSSLVRIALAQYLAVDRETDKRLTDG